MVLTRDGNVDADAILVEVFAPYDDLPAFKLA